MSTVRINVRQCWTLKMHMYHNQSGNAWTQIFTTSTSSLENAQTKFANTTPLKFHAWNFANQPCWNLPDQTCIFQTLALQTCTLQMQMFTSTLHLLHKPKVVHVLRYTTLHMFQTHICCKHKGIASASQVCKMWKKTCFQLAHAMFCKFCKHRVCNCAFVLCIRHEFTHLQIKLTRLRTKLTSLLNRDCTFANTTWKCEEHIVSMLATKSANVQNNKLEHSKRKHC